MRIRKSIGVTILLSFLALNQPISAASREVAGPRVSRPFERVVRVVKRVAARFFGVSSNGDSMIPPTP